MSMDYASAVARIRAMAGQTVGDGQCYALSGYYKFFPLFECRAMKDLPSNYKNQFIVLDYEVFTQM